MTDTPPNSLPPLGDPAAGIIGRAKDIILKPKETWPVIAAESATTQSIFVPYVVILAAIGPIAGFIGGQVFGISLLGVTYKPPLVGALVQAVLGYGISLVTVFLLSLIIDALAQNFGGQKNPTQALKVAAYSGTAGWIAGILGLIPVLSLLGLLAGIYGLYLLYLGLPVLMKAPEEKALGYTAVVVVVWIVLVVIASVVIGAITAPLLMATV